jgi:hypothetical protein
VTLTIVTAELWRDALAKEAGDETVRHVDAALDAFDLVLDVATSEQPLSEALIRRLHELATAAQDTYEVVVDLDGGRVAQDQALLKGTYKVNPNHVQQPDGSFHAYASVDETAHEMLRLVEETRSTAFESAHPVVQAAYVHHALACVHPFADGNGRVSRLLASIYLLRAVSVPLVIYEDEKVGYLTALRAADVGDRKTFANFVFDQAIDAMGWATDEVNGGELRVGGSEIPSGEIVLGRRAGAERLRNLVEETLDSVVGAVEPWADEIWNSGTTSSAVPTPAFGDRKLVPGMPTRRIDVWSDVLQFSATRQVVVVMTLKQPLGFPLAVVSGDQALDVRDSDIHPEVTIALRSRIEAFCRSVVKSMLDELEQAIARTQQ